MKNYIIAILAVTLLVDIGLSVSKAQGDNLHRELAANGIPAPQISATIKVMCRSDGTLDLKVDPKP